MNTATTVPLPAWANNAYPVEVEDGVIVAGVSFVSEDQTFNVGQDFALIDGCWVPYSAIECTVDGQDWTKSSRTLDEALAWATQLVNDLEQIRALVEQPVTP